MSFNLKGENNATKAVHRIYGAWDMYFLTVTASSQPVPDGQYPSGPDYLVPSYPPDMSNTGPNYPNYQGPQNGPGMNPSPADSEGGHPAIGPDSLQPLSAPSGSNTEALSYAEGQSLSQQDVALSGGLGGGLSGGSGSSDMAFMMVAGLQVWTRYNGIWTVDPAAVFFWRSTSLLSYNDQAQTVWSWERYPNGQQNWRNLGYRMPGYFHGRFIGDARGWHELAMWGSRSGWSNVVWIYVW